METVEKILCFGDSHVSIFNNKSELIAVEKFIHVNNFTLYQFGPWLAYRLPERIREFKEALSKVDRTAYKYDLLLFGEIDCRAQIKKISTEQNRNPKDIIDEVLSKYQEFIDSVMDPSRLIVVSVCPCYLESPYEEFYIRNEGSHDRPRGTMKERNQYKKIFNQSMKRYCKDRGIKFISIFNQIQNHADKSSLYLDEIHLDPIKIDDLLKAEFQKNKIATY